MSMQGPSQMPGLGKPGELQIAPLPTNIQLAQAQQPDGSMTVVVVFTTPQGVNGFHLNAEAAKKIGEGMVKLASGAAAGLVLPGTPGAEMPAGTAGPSGNGGNGG
jgi:hypothetical protein